MCACGSGPERFGPIYNGRYAMLGAQPATSRVGAAAAIPPGAKTNVSCPGCRVGAYQGTEDVPPMPFGQDFLMANRYQGLPLQFAPPQLQPQLAYAWPRSMVPVVRLR